MASSGRSNLDHFFIDGLTRGLPSTRKGGGDPRVRPVEDRQDHGRARKAELELAVREFSAARDELEMDELKALGVVVTITAASADYPLQIESLEQWSRHRAQSERKPWWLLLAVTVDQHDAESAAVWISDGQVPRFLTLFDDYLSKTTKPSRKFPDGRPRHEGLIANMASIRRSIARDLWTSPGEPPTSTSWLELVVRGRDEAVALLHGLAEHLGIRLAGRTMEFDDRTVVWCSAPWESIEQLVLTRVELTEVRRPSRISSVLDLSTGEQDDYVDDLIVRLTDASPDSPVAVCLLDSGLLPTHALLEPFITLNDVHSAIAGADGADVHGHGTLLGGLVMYGDLRNHFESSAPVEVSHSLESVKILPDTGANDEWAYALLTATAVSLPETQRSHRRRVYNLSVTAEGEPLKGAPTTWSAAVDLLATGAGIDQSTDGTLRLLSEPDSDAARLFIISAGNVRATPSRQFLDTADLSSVEEPAQAWNVLTVGAYTERCAVPEHPDFDGWDAVAPSGELSPHSRTGVMASRSWPNKPDVVFEGGNILMSPDDSAFESTNASVALLSTSHQGPTSVDTVWATSAATALASNLAARVALRYPDAWPETVRALVVHSAEWTDPMVARFDAASKTNRLPLLRRYGWGVPTASRALSSAGNAATMVMQDEFQPFEGSDHKVREFRMHDLPWPSDTLRQLGPLDVRLRITLSYFVEPSVGSRGWRTRYSYASHGLRFELKRPLESEPDFIRRINKIAEYDDSGERVPTTADAVNWYLGPYQRDRGCLVADIWNGSAASLADCDQIAVRPVGGWWKYNKRKDRSDRTVRYALVLSLDTADESVDLYTSIQLALRSPIGVPIGSV